MIKLIVSFIGLNIVMLPYYIFVFTLGVMVIERVDVGLLQGILKFAVVLGTFLVMSIPSMLALFFLKQKRVKVATKVFYAERVLHFAVVVGCYISIFFTNK
ncbi:hypothetical protein FT641_18525 [Bacillus paranthracis]|uniref:hypothetical protein n=1 Tax=Bacillus paranthracis TaxID=2026186 RepID=UPI00187A6C98|nr:hypothetical protein [Bacillus paranthracis]MBE7114440.1 hypothetical protein [Bacillus paranthracis]MBE7154686.1 hypothetical protein [Bacillus paranthracis]